MRLRTYLLCLGLVGCATSTPKTATLPTSAVLAAAIQTVFIEARLGGAPEVSVIRSSFQPLPGDWVVCLRGNGPDRAQKYAIFFQNGQYLSSRIATVADQCDEQAYVPAPAAAPPADADHPPQDGNRRKKRGADR